MRGPPLVRIAALALLASLAGCGQSTTTPTDPVSISAVNVAEGVAGEPYTQRFIATGGNGSFSWTVSSGTLPAGLALSGGGVLSGTPTQTGTFGLTLVVTSGDQSSALSIQLVIAEPLQVRAELPIGVIGVPYAGEIVASGGTGSFTFAVSAGSLPDGLGLDASGTIAGTPTVVGTETLTFEVTSGAQTESLVWSLTISDPVEIATATLATGVRGTAYAVDLAVTGGNGVNTWSLVGGALPDGLTLDTGGAIAGTPTTVEDASFTVQVESAGQTDTQALDLRVTEAVVIHTTSLPAGVTGVSYEEQLAATGGDGTYTWAIPAGSRPPGLTLVEVDGGGPPAGTITGAPTQPGDFDVTVEASSGGISGAMDLTIIVTLSTTITTDALPSGSVGEAYDQAITAEGGDGTFFFSVVSGGLPPGLDLAGATGVITGTPMAAGIYPFDVEASSDGTTDVQSLFIVVTEGACTPTSLPDTDGDRLPDCVETNTRVFVSASDTGTDPLVMDTDDDGIDDGDEVLGSVGGLDLPGMGTNPLRKNILIEYDWFADLEGGGAHDHRPTLATITRVKLAFANAPVDNPDGSTGITAIQDYGQGGLFTEGTEVSDPDGCIEDGVAGSDYAAFAAGNFPSDRMGYFHYSLMIHQHDADGPGSCLGASSSSGEAIYNDYRLLVSSNWWHNASDGDQWVANTIVHELGHNLNLSHGGERFTAQQSLNYKPNYPSVMNYRYQFGGVDVTCDGLADGALNYSSGLNLTLDESNLDESVGVCGAPGVDWNVDGDAGDSGIQVDVQGWDVGPGSAEANGSATDVLEDHDDWAAITLASSLSGALSPLPAVRVLDVATCPSIPVPIGARR